MAASPPHTAAAVQPSLSDFVATLAASVIPPHLSERAASHARIRGAFNFVAGKAPAGEELVEVELTDEAVELIDDIMGKMVEDAAEHAASLAALRQSQGAATVRPVAAAPLPTAPAAAAALAAGGVGHKLGGPDASLPILNSADVGAYLAEVWPAIVLPSSELAARIEPALPMPEMPLLRPAAPAVSAAAMGGAGMPGGAGIPSVPPPTVASAGPGSFSQAQLQASALAAYGSQAKRSRQG